jgi:hypothetical protein
MYNSVHTVRQARVQARGLLHDRRRTIAHRAVRAERSAADAVDALQQGDLAKADPSQANARRQSARIDLERKSPTEALHHLDAAARSQPEAAIARMQALSKCIVLLKRRPFWPACRPTTSR